LINIMLVSSLTFPITNFTSVFLFSIGIGFTAFFLLILGEICDLLFIYILILFWPWSLISALAIKPSFFASSNSFLIHSFLVDYLFFLFFPSLLDQLSEFLSFYIFFHTYPITSHCFIRCILNMILFHTFFYFFSAWSLFLIIICILRVFSHYIIHFSIQYITSL
jgi:hypothetical protein